MYFKFQSPFVILTLTSLSLSLALSVAVDGNKHLTLPENNVKIFASTWPHPPNMTFRYIWRKLFGPSDGDITGLHQKIISLTNVM